MAAKQYNLGHGVFVNEQTTDQYNLGAGVFVNETSSTGGTAATAVTFTGPSTCNAGEASTNFTISVDNPTITGTLVVTPHSNHSGAFSPTTVSLTTGSPFGYVTFTPTTSGVHTLSCTDDGGLTDPATIPFGVVPTIDVVLVASPTDSTPAANLSSLRWCWWDVTDPNLMDTTTAVDASASETTDGSGNFHAALPHSVGTGLLASTGTLMIWNGTNPTKVGVGIFFVT